MKDKDLRKTVSSLQCRIEMIEKKLQNKHLDLLETERLNRDFQIAGSPLFPICTADQESAVLPVPLSGSGINQVRRIISIGNCQINRLWTSRFESIEKILDVKWERVPEHCEHKSTLPEQPKGKK